MGVISRCKACGGGKQKCDLANSLPLLMQESEAKNGGYHILDASRKKVEWFPKQEPAWQPDGDEDNGAPPAGNDDAAASSLHKSKQPPPSSSTPRRTTRKRKAVPPPSPPPKRQRPLPTKTNPPRRRQPTRHQPPTRPPTSSADLHRSRFTQARAEVTKTVAGDFETRWEFPIYRDEVRVTDPEGTEAAIDAHVAAFAQNTAGSSSLQESLALINTSLELAAVRHAQATQTRNFLYAATYNIDRDPIPRP